MDRVAIFDYPTTPHARRHGPFGYADYESYRDWLRDEFSFRCVYCLKRELWVIRLGSFHLDHFVAQALDPTRALEYDNLFYVCAGCNALKCDSLIPNPCEVPLGECIRVHDDGAIEALNANGEILIDQLRLDHPDHTQFRSRMLRTLQYLLQQEGTALFNAWTRYPDDLPDLSRKHAPGNTRPEGLTQSCFARRMRGELPATY